MKRMRQSRSARPTGQAGDSKLSEIVRSLPDRQAGPLSQYAQFLYECMAGHTHFLTITSASEFCGDSASICRTQLERHVSHFLRRLSRKCFGNQHKKQGRSVLSVVVIEKGRKFDGTHAHLTLECPESISPAAFSGHVFNALRRCQSLGREHKIEPIADLLGLANYLAKDGPEGFSDRCSQRA